MTKVMLGCAVYVIGMIVGNITAAPGIQWEACVIGGLFAGVICGIIAIEK